MKKRIEKRVEESKEEAVDTVKEYSPYTLVARSTFGKYKKGDQIHDPSKVNELLQGEYGHLVLKVKRKGAK